MRELFKYAAWVAKQNVFIKGAEQGIHSQILGEQENERESRWAIQGQDTVRELKRKRMETSEAEDWNTYEFGIGLDFERSWSWLTAHSQDDAKWLVSSDKEATEDAIKESPLNVKIPRIFRGLQNDLQRLPKPFKDLSDHRSIAEEVKERTWADVPLYTDLWTGVTPATIHFNGKDSNTGRKFLRDEGWWSMWFSAYVRLLFDASIARFAKGSRNGYLVAKLYGKEFYGIVSDQSVRQNGFGTETVNRKGERGWIRWDEMCNNCTDVLLNTIE